MLNSRVEKPVALPPGRARLSTKPPPTGSIVVTNTIGTVRLACCKPATIEPAVARMTSGASATKFRSVFAKAVHIARTPAIVDAHIAAGAPAAFLQPLRERRDMG